MATKKSVSKTSSDKMANVRKGRKAVAPENETKDARFVRLINHRVPRLLKLIKQLGALGGPAYESTDQQRQHVSDTLIRALQTALDNLNKKRSEDVGFKL